MKNIMILLLKVVCLNTFWLGSLYAKTAAEHEPETQQSINDLTEYISEINATTRGTVEVISVGLGENCHFNFIQNAIDSADINTNYEIRIVNDQIYSENLILAHPNMTLKGGYGDCDDAQADNNNNEKVFLEAAVAEPVLILKNISEGDGITFYYQLINLDISGGTGTDTAPSGGINILNNQITLNADNLLIHDNQGLSGGGIYVEGEQTDAIFTDTFVLLNSADNGGGLFCDHANLLISGNSGVTLNDANGLIFKGNGGGIFLTNGCSLEMFSGTSGGFLDFRGIAANTANRNGGGLFIENGSLVNLWGNFEIGDYGDLEQPINISNNSANLGGTVGAGGGIYAQGVNTTINAFATIINENEVMSGSVSDAGAIYIEDNAEFNMNRLNFDCWDQLRCSQIKDNKVSIDSNSSSGGIFAIFGAELSIKNTWLSGHTSSGADLLFAQASKINLEGNMIVENGDFLVDGFGDLMRFWNTHPEGINMKHNTFANNDVDQLFKLSQNESFSFRASIVKENPGTQILLVNAGSTPNMFFKDLLTHESASFSGTNILVADPLFKDEQLQDYRLSEASPAIDFYNEFDNPDTSDIENQPRGWDYPGANDLFKPFDVGADEFYPDNTADLSLELTSNALGPYFNEQTIEFNLRLTNTGPNMADGISISFHTSNLSAPEIINDDVCSNLPNTGFCFIDGLNNGEFIDLTLQSEIIDTGDFFLEMSASSLSYDNDLSNNISLWADTAITAQADLKIIDNLNIKEPLYAQQVLAYQITVSNEGPHTARSVWANFTGENVTLLSVNESMLGSDFLYDVATELDNQSSRSFDVSIMIDAPDNYSWAWSVFADFAEDPNILNNELTYQGSAFSNGDLAIETNLLTEGPYHVNQTVDFEVNYLNNGPFGVNWAEVGFDLTNLKNLTIVGDCDQLPCYPQSTLLSGEGGTLNVSAVIVSTGVFNLNSSFESEYAHDEILKNNYSSDGSTADVDPDVIFIDDFE